MTELSPYLVYATPPLIGAFIGYLTNKVAIKMLFRPLRRWHIGPLKIPMTPGVIPAKRHELAANIGEMVGEHLLTGDEISLALQKDRFQEHLRMLIESKAASFMKMDLGSLQSIIPSTYKSHFDIAYKTIVYQIRKSIHSQLQSDTAISAAEAAADRLVDELLNRPFEGLFGAPEQDRLLAFLESAVDQALYSPELEARLAAFIGGEIDALAADDKSVADIIPAQLHDQIVETIRSQAPFVLDKAAALAKDPDIRDKIVAAVKGAIAEFVDTLGPMSAMVKNFLEIDMLDRKIREYLIEKEEDLDLFLHQEEFLIRVRAGLGERISALLATPLSRFLTRAKTEQIDALASEISNQILTLARKPNSRESILNIISEVLTKRLEQGGGAIGPTLEQIVGKDALQNMRGQIKNQVATVLRSPEGLQIADQLVETLCTKMISRPLGRLDHLVPATVVEGVCNSLQKMTTRLLISEVPGIVKSIDIRKIVTDRIDSFDLLRLERLLLSIMEEQFKYINLFGALLGFLIGCVNLILIAGG